MKFVLLQNISPEMGKNVNCIYLFLLCSPLYYFITFMFWHSYIYIYTLAVPKHIDEKKMF